MSKYYILFAIPVLLLFSTNNVLAQNTSHKKFCLSAIDSKNVDELKKLLLSSVKREAVSEIFGELISTFTKVESGLLTEDKIKLASSGYVRIKGSPVYENGANFGEVCVQIDAYTTDEDKEKFEPIKISNKYCATNSEFTTKKIKDFAKKHSIIEALVKYDRNLDKLDDNHLLKLVHEVKYLESGFIPETETYCSKMEGVLYPIEVTGLLIAKNNNSSTKNIKENVVKKITIPKSLIFGNWKINANGFTGSLEITKLNGMLTGRVRFDSNNRWVKAANIKLNKDVVKFNLARQAYTGKYTKENINGTFISRGLNYKWTAIR